MKTITIICEDHAGVLFKVADALKRRGVNIKDIVAQGLSDKGAISVSVEAGDEDRTLATLRGLGYTPLVQDTFIIKLQDRPGELAKVTRALKKEGINIESMRILSQCAGQALVALATDQPKKTRVRLKKMLVS